MLPEGSAAVIAYQRLALLELRNVYDGVELDLEHYLGVEQHTSDRVDTLEKEFSEVRRALTSLGADQPKPDDAHVPAGTPTPHLAGAEYTDAGVERGDSFEELVEHARTYLVRAGVDLGKDPLLQVLNSEEISEASGSYDSRYGSVDWDEGDYLVVVLAGFIATLLDIFLVRIPTDIAFLGKMQPGSPLTKWLKENSIPVHEHFLRRFEDAARVPYDAVRDRAVEGLHPKVHRLMSLGHDPILGFIFGVIDVMGATGTFIDKNGDLRRVSRSVDKEGLTVAFLKVFLHLLSDVCTRAGIQPPFFTLLQLAKAESPFALGPSGEQVPWTDVARYMYVHGYDLRHFATMGIVPASVEMIIRGWWLLGSFAKKDDPEQVRAKLASMLLLGHAIATSGNLIKTGAIYGMNPLALNWAEALTLVPVIIAWINETSNRERDIRNRLDAEWANIYRVNQEL